MSAGWFDPTLGAWFDETEQEAGWFDASLVDEESSGGGGTITAVLVGARGVAGGSSSNATTGGTTTTGSTFAVCLLYTTSGSISSITDSKSNSYTLGVSQDNLTADITAAIYYCENGTGGASHTATVNFSGSVDSTVWLIEITGAATASFDQVASAQDGSDPYQVTSPTLSQAAECVLTLFGADRGSTGTISTSDSTLIDSEPAGTSGWAGGVSKVITSSTSAVTVSFSDAHGTHPDTLALVTFKQASGAASFSGSGTPSLQALTASGSGTKARKGSGTPSLPALTASGSGKKARSGTGTPSLPTLTASGAGTKARKGSGSPSLPALTASGSGSITSGPVTWEGAGDATLPTLTASGTGKKSRSGSGSATLPALTASGTAEPGAVTHFGSGDAFLPALTGSGSSPSGTASEQPSGGYGWANLVAAERRRNKRQRELEEEADRLEMALAAEGLTTPAPEVVARFTVREYANAADTFSRRTQRAIAYAERAQTALAYELAARQLQKEIDDEESAIAMLLALVA